MKIVKLGFGGRNYETSVESAVEELCDGSDYGLGSVEQANNAAKKTASFVGCLVEVLYNKGIINDEEILSLLGSNYARGEEC